MPGRSSSEGQRRAAHARPDHTFGHGLPGPSLAPRASALPGRHAPESPPPRVNPSSHPSRRAIAAAEQYTGSKTTSRASRP
nr:MAG TPA: hypothetical protein [Caudoviricetes sp.]